ncbi:hypothetical protein ACF08N_11820 [Streptomyces sp. NPDC015127]|uniref:8-oxoguanine DNA glycosylase OGG fold protein n=1 Tax=Streptomyces sp. NPDC015127 TaxID=3364939 RepID=UPI0036F9D313
MSCSANHPPFVTRTFWGRPFRSTLVGRWPTVDRRTVFEMAEHADTSEGRRDLLIAALAWGTGTRAQSVARRARIFHENDLDWLDERICRAKAEIERGDPVAIWC